MTPQEINLFISTISLLLIVGFGVFSPIINLFWKKKKKHKDFLLNLFYESMENVDRGLLFPIFVHLQSRLMLLGASKREAKKIAKKVIKISPSPVGRASKEQIRFSGIHRDEVISTLSSVVKPQK